MAIEQIFYGEQWAAAVNTNGTGTVDVEIARNGAYALAENTLTGYEMSNLDFGTIRTGVKQVRFIDAAGNPTSTDYPVPTAGEMPVHVVEQRMTGVTFGLFIDAEGYTMGRAAFHVFTSD